MAKKESGKAELSPELSSVNLIIGVSTRAEPEKVQAHYQYLDQFYIKKQKETE